MDDFGVFLDEVKWWKVSSVGWKLTEEGNWKLTAVTVGKGRNPGDDDRIFVSTIERVRNPA